MSFLRKIVVKIEELLYNIYYNIITQQDVIELDYTKSMIAHLHIRP